MNVLHVTLSFGHGGRREAIAELCRGLAPLGVTNNLCCLEHFDSTERERAGVFADAIELNRHHLFDWAAFRRLSEYCEQHAIDVVHAHDAASQAACVFALPHAGPPILMTFHRTRNFESARPRDRLRNAIAGLRMGAVVTASEERRRHYIHSNHVQTAKVRCIPLGIDLARFRPDPQRRAAQRARLGIGENCILVGTVGHFGPEKGVDLAVDAFQLVAARNPGLDAEMVVLGSGSEQQECFVRERVDEHLADRVRFVGFQKRPEEWFPAFDLLLHGARDEAFGLVLTEAMACGVPIVAARVGGIPEVVDEGCARLADAADADSLANALEGALKDADWRGRAGAHALERARAEFGRERFAQRYFELYRALIDRAVAA